MITERLKKNIAFRYFQWANRHLDVNFLMILIGILTGLTINTYTIFGHNWCFYVAVSGFCLDLFCLASLIAIQNEIKSSYDTSMEEQIIDAETSHKKEGKQPFVSTAEMIARAKEESLTNNPGHYLQVPFLSLFFLLAFIGSVAYLQAGVGKNVHQTTEDNKKVQQDLNAAIATGKRDSVIIKTLQDSLMSLDHYIKRHLPAKPIKPCKPKVS